MTLIHKHLRQVLDANGWYIQSAWIIGRQFLSDNHEKARNQGGE